MSACTGPYEDHGLECCSLSPVAEFPPCPRCSGGQIPACDHLSAKGCTLGDACDQVDREECDRHPCRSCGGTGLVACDDCLHYLPGGGR